MYSQSPVSDLTGPGYLLSIDLLIATFSVGFVERLKVDILRMKHVLVLLTRYVGGDGLMTSVFLVMSCLLTTTVLRVWILARPPLQLALHPVLMEGLRHGLGASPRG